MPKRLCLCLATLILAVVPPYTAIAAAPQSAAPKDGGSHAFDWDIGAWSTHQRRLLHPLTNSHQWVDYQGTDVVTKLWDGADYGIIKASGSGGKLHIFTMRLYDPQSHQWSIDFTYPGLNVMTNPLYGGFKNGAGEFIDQEAYNGKMILVRFQVSDITANTCRFEQAFSADGGKSWEVNFIVTETRMKESAGA
ncbi:MAG TPA: hypothetical protein VGR92_07655 [Steroidobacteraceae bacterium]|nr:hypothetical protein [Steroidobacteraceae bacterium]